ncbi:MAG TPA: hypothetical protein VJ385_16540 [Fibrobacteria bacterium]|nr:hypothetical protein [Fibrobacteria bacterium]
MKLPRLTSKAISLLVLVGVLAFVLNRPNGFLPAWIKTITWHLSNKPEASINGLTIQIPLMWWEDVSSTSEITFLRTPSWNSEYSGTFTIKKGCRTEIQFDSLLSAKAIGGDSIISADEERIVISGQVFRGVRLHIHDKSNHKNLMFETYPIFPKGITINIIDYPIKLRNQLNELFMNIHF